MSYYSVSELHKNIYRITSRENVYCELIVGSERALLIDTGYGFANLRETVEQLTDKPIIVVNTHGHLDHVDGNHHFNDCPIYMHEKDLPVYESYFTPEARKKSIERAKHTPLCWGSDEVINALPDGFDENKYMYEQMPRVSFVKENDQFDLGGVILKVVELPGHTWGSIGLFNEENKELYVGDAANAHVLVCVSGANISTYKKTLQKLMNLDFDYMIQGHVERPVLKSDLKIYMECVEKMSEENCYVLESPFEPGTYQKMFIREGYSMTDIQKEGFASIVTDDAHMD